MKLLNILPSVISAVLNAQVKTVVHDYDAVAKEVRPRVVDKPWYLSRGMVSAVILVGVGLLNLFTGQELDFTDIETLTNDIDSIVLILGGIGAGVGRAGAAK